MIPKTIHYFWVGGNPKPENVIFCIESWKQYCPEYQIIEWNETNYDFSKNEYMRQAYDARKWGFVPDYARLDVIYEHGGIYLDTDVEIIRPMDTLLGNQMFAGFEKTTEKDHYVALGLGFGAEAGNTLIREMRDEYNGVKFIEENGTLNLLPSPRYSTRVLRRHGLLNKDCDQIIESAMIYASDVLCPKMYCSSETKVTERTASIHHYDATWLDGDRKRLHNRNVRLNIVFGDAFGNKIARMLEDAEYLAKAVHKRIRKAVKRG